MWDDSPFDERRCGILDEKRKENALYHPCRRLCAGEGLRARAGLRFLRDHAGCNDDIVGNVGLGEQRCNIRPFTLFLDLNGRSSGSAVQLDVRGCATEPGRVT